MTSTTPTKAAAAKPVAKKTTAKKTTAKKTAPSKAAAAAKKLAAPPAAAKKTAAKTSTAPRAGDVLTQHIAEVFAKLPKGTFLKVAEIAAVRTKSFPNEGTRPSSQTISGRCRDDRMPEGIKGTTGPRGAKKL